MRTLALIAATCLAALQAHAYDFGTKYGPRSNVGDAHPAPMVSGLWYAADPGSTGTTVSLEPNTTYYIPMTMPKSAVVGDIHIRLTSAGNNQIRYGIVAADPSTCAPGNLLASSTGTSIATTGPRIDALSPSIYLPAGEYYIATIVSASANVTASARNNSSSAAWLWRCGLTASTNFLFDGVNIPLGYRSAVGATPYDGGISTTNITATISNTSRFPGAAFKVK